MFKFVLPVALVLGLGACDQGAQLAQQAASSVGAIVGQEIKNQANAVIDQTVGEASEALAPFGINASQVSGAIKDKTSSLISQAMPSNVNWTGLNSLAGKTPNEIGLFTAVSPIDGQLNTLLGEQATAIKAALAGAVLKQDKVLYLLSDQPDQATWLLIDTANRKLAAGQIVNGQLKNLPSAGEAIQLPSEISALQSKLLK
ncbi:hypothetical protein HQN60_10160 [Deefgea piscis]|uniref:Lipoprotein n=1 Tax=Deefgea piscis TaxID=2739061 RepID=A0A6M8SWN2_9NEIS|nr:hypothetical protein [Deefgea piscis]QKJ67029.1 hypothetical protein HQN60_10160 [Deefgea piscis]